MLTDEPPVHESEDQFSGGIFACNHSAVTCYAHPVQSYRGPDRVSCSDTDRHLTEDS